MANANERVWELFRLMQSPGGGDQIVELYYLATKTPRGHMLPVGMLVSSMIQAIVKAEFPDYIPGPWPPDPPH